MRVILASLLLLLCLMTVALAADSTATRPETIDILLSSHAHRGFTEEPVSREELDLIVQCGIEAPSAMNAQPWRFTVVTNPDIAEQIVSGTKGAVIVISGAQQGMSTQFDCGLATEAMYTAAQTLGLGANIYLMPVAQVNSNMRDTLSIPVGYDAVMVMTVGHIGEDAVSSASPRGDTKEIVNFVE